MLGGLVTVVGVGAGRVGGLVGVQEGAGLLAHRPGQVARQPPHAVVAAGQRQPSARLLAGFVADQRGSVGDLGRGSYDAYRAYHDAPDDGVSQALAVADSVARTGTTVAGGAIGATAGAGGCTATVVLAPLAPVCGAAGGIAGGFVAGKLYDGASWVGTEIGGWFD